MHIEYTLIILVAVSVVVVMFGLVAKRKAHQKRLMNAPFPSEWIEILKKNLPPYLHLPDELRNRLHGYINVFLDGKYFEGCGGQEITDEIRVTVAAQACLLIIGQSSECYPKLRSILVYPHTYVAGGKGLFGAQNEPPSARLGESWQNGSVVLSWNSVKGGAVNFDDGHNVTLHEFAHQLDQADGTADGTPILENFSCYSSWARSLSGEYRLFLKKVKKHKKTVIDKYGATHPAEFFATATEAFFEKPEQLSKNSPDLYEELKSYYKLDPSDWS